MKKSVILPLYEAPQYAEQVTDWIWQAFGEGNLYLNPGSVSLPKENSPHSYLTLEGGKFLWKELDGTVYHELNI